MGADVSPQGSTAEGAQHGPGVRGLDIAAGTLIGLAVLAFAAAGDLRTGWIVGDTGPLDGREGIGRVGFVALLAGLAVVAVRQHRSRRALAPNRYRGASPVILLVIAAGLSVLAVVPYQRVLNLLFEGGIPDLIPLLVWELSTPVATLLVAWVAVLRTDALAGFRPFARDRMGRNVVIGVLGGAASFGLIVGLSMIVGLVTTGRVVPYEGELPLLVGVPTYPAALAVAGAVVLAPIAEETFFRGVMLEAWRREHGTLLAVLGSSIAFGAVHFGLGPVEALPAALPSLAILGIAGAVFAGLALRTGSLVAPIVAHAVHNALPMLSALVLV